MSPLLSFIPCHGEASKNVVYNHLLFTKFLSAVILFFFSILCSVIFNLLMYHLFRHDTPRTSKRKTEKKLKTRVDCKRTRNVCTTKIPPDLKSTHGTEEFSYEKIYFMSSQRWGNKLRRLNLMEDIFGKLFYHQKVESTMKCLKYCAIFKIISGGRFSPRKTLIKKFPAVLIVKWRHVCALTSTESHHHSVNVSYFFCSGINSYHS